MQSLRWNWCSPVCTRARGSQSVLVSRPPWPDSSSWLVCASMLTGKLPLISNRVKRKEFGRLVPVVAIVMRFSLGMWRLLYCLCDVVEFVPFPSFELTFWQDYFRAYALAFYCTTSWGLQHIQWRVPVVTANPPLEISLSGFLLMVSFIENHYYRHLIFKRDL